MTTGPIKPLAEIQFHELKEVKAQEGALELNGKLYEVVLIKKGGKHVSLSKEQLQSLKKWMKKSKIKPEQLHALSKNRVVKGAKLKNVDQLRSIQVQYNSIIGGGKIQPPLEERVGEAGQKAMSAMSRAVLNVEDKTKDLLGRINQNLGRLKQKIRLFSRRIFQPKLHQKEQLLNHLAAVYGGSFNRKLALDYIEKNPNAGKLLEEYACALEELKNAENSSGRMKAILHMEEIRDKIVLLEMPSEFVNSRLQFESLFVLRMFNFSVNEHEASLANNGFHPSPFAHCWVKAVNRNGSPQLLLRHPQNKELIQVKLERPQLKGIKKADIDRAMLQYVCQDRYTDGKKWIEEVYSPRINTDQAKKLGEHIEMQRKNVDNASKLSAEYFEGKLETLAPNCKQLDFYEFSQEYMKEKLLEVDGELNLTEENVQQMKGLFADPDFVEKCSLYFLNMNTAPTLEKSLEVFHNEFEPYLASVLKELSGKTPEESFNYGAEDIYPVIQAAFIAGGDQVIHFAKSLEHVEPKNTNGISVELKYRQTLLQEFSNQIFA